MVTLTGVETVTMTRVWSHYTRLCYKNPLRCADYQ